MKYFEFTLIYDSVDEVLLYNPEEWETCGINYSRDKIYGGVFKGFTPTTFRFARKAGAGGDFLYNAFTLEGIRAVVDIIIKERNPQTDDYDTIFTGIISFNPDTTQIMRDFIEVGFIDSGKIQKFINNDEIDFDITSTEALDGTTIDEFSSQPVDITFKSIDIYAKVSGINQPVAMSGSLLNDTSEDFTFEVTSVLNQIGDRLDESNSLLLYTNTTGSTVSLDWTRLRVNPNLTLTFVYPGDPNNSETFRLEMIFQRVNDSDVVTHSHSEIIGDIDVEDITEDTIEYMTDIYDVSDFISTFPDLPNGYYINAFLRITNLTLVGQGAGMTVNYTGNVNIALLSFTEISLGEPDTTVKCYYPNELFTREIQLITGETDTDKLFESPVFGRPDSEFTTQIPIGDWPYLVATSGWNIRGFTGRAFNVNLRDTFLTYSSILNLGLGYEEDNDRFVIDKLENFFDPDLIIASLGEVSDLVIQPMSDAYYNQLLTGYDDEGDYEDFQGVNEFNIQTQHAANVPVKNEKDLRAKYKASSVFIEITRREQYATNADKDTKGDDQIFIVDTDGSETIQGGTSLTRFEGIDQYYNIRIAPRENLIRHGNVLKQAFYPTTDDTIIKFISSKKKTNITYENQNGDVVNEFDNIEADELDEPLFIPLLLKFKGIFTKEISESIPTNWRGIFKFTFRNIEMEGFIDEIKANEYEGEADYTLIAKATVAGQLKYFMDDELAQFMDDKYHEVI